MVIEAPPPLCLLPSKTKTQGTYIGQDPTMALWHVAILAMIMIVLSHKPHMLHAAILGVGPSARASSDL